MRGYTVYRVDYVTGKKEAIGSILERRSGDGRGKKKQLALLRGARRLFGRGPADAFRIVLDSPRDSRELRTDDVGGDPDLVTMGGYPDF